MTYSLVTNLYEYIYAVEHTQKDIWKNVSTVNFEAPFHFFVQTV